MNLNSEYPLSEKPSDLSRHSLVDKFSLSLPVVVAPMFIISQPELVIACCSNQVIAAFPSLNCRTSEIFEKWIIDIQTELEQYERLNNRTCSPYAVNLIVHKSNPRVNADLEVCVRNKVPIVITSLGSVKEVVESVHSYGGLVFHDVINRHHAEKAIQAGVDGLILVCAGAGGHTGTLNPMAFISEVREIFDGVILLSGGITNGQDIAVAQQMGADFAYMGTRFINTHESNACPQHKQMIIEAQLSDIIRTSAVSGVSANFLKNSLLSAGIDEEKLSLTGSLDFDKKDIAKAWTDIWSAGQGATAIRDVLSATTLIDRLRKQFFQAIDQQKSRAMAYC